MVTKNSLVNCMLLSFVFHSAVCIQKWIRGILQTGLQVPEAAQWSHPTLNFFPHWYFFSIVARWFLYFKLSQLKSCRKAVNGKKKKNWWNFLLIFCLFHSIRNILIWNKYFFQRLTQRFYLLTKGIESHVES